MNTKPFGCLTAFGLISALLTALVVVVVGLTRGDVLFSPGALNSKAGAMLGGVTSHAGLGGNCSGCHVAFWQTASMADKCVVCHTDVAVQQKDISTLHGSLLKYNPSLTCRTCHPDHRGPTITLTDMSKINISHDSFGYALTAHPHQTDGTPFACNTCHVNGYGKFDQTVCTTCHQQINANFMQSHLQVYADNCLGCHDGIDTYGHKFDHSTAVFHLTGKHTGVGCGGCHTGARTIADLKATRQDCAACHQKNDPHNGQFGTDCGACHTAAGWTPATFDHNLSSFKLAGKHAGVACTSCHINNVFKGTPTACAGCHADPAYHAGLFAGSACDQCHNTNAWIPALYTGPHPNCGERNCLQHHRATCADCHTANLMTATCLKCHDSNNPGERGGGG
jgi:hypothetical protein